MLTCVHTCQLHACLNLLLARRWLTPLGDTIYPQEMVWQLKEIRGCKTLARLGVLVISLEMHIPCVQEIATEEVSWVLVDWLGPHYEYEWHPNPFPEGSPFAETVRVLMPKPFSFFSYDLFPRNPGE